MMLLNSAEWDYRAKDRDGNHVEDFWTGDVAGLLKFGMIPRELAEADLAPLQALVPKPIPYHGYYFKVLIADNFETPPVAYRQETDKTSGKVHHLTKFGFVAIPADRGTSGKRFYVVNENNTIFPTIENMPAAPVDWPTDEELKMYYSKIQ